MNPTSTAHTIHISEAVVQLLIALMRSWDFFSRHPDRVMQWYIDDTRLDYTPESLVSARLDKNFGSASLKEISLELSADHIATLERSAAWARDSGEGLVDLSRAADTRPLTTAMENIRDEEVTPIATVVGAVLAEEQGETRVNVLFTRALNDVFNLHTKRVVLGTYYRIPSAMWLALFFASGVAMFAVGLQFGISGNQRIHAANLALAVTFALVMVLAFDLDRAGEGLVSVNQQPMIDLYQSMRI